MIKLTLRLLALLCMAYTFDSVFFHNTLLPQAATFIHYTVLPHAAVIVQHTVFSPRVRAAAVTMWENSAVWVHTNLLGTAGR